MNLEDFKKLLDSKGIWYKPSFTGTKVCIDCKTESENRETYNIRHLFKLDGSLFDVEIW